MTTLDHLNKALEILKEKSLEVYSSPNTYSYRVLFNARRHLNKQVAEYFQESH